VYEHRAGKDCAAIPTPSAVAVELEVALFKAQRADELPNHLALGLAMVKRNHAVDFLYLEPGVCNGFEARLGGEAQGRHA
jgi:hypothetical protein